MTSRFPVNKMNQLNSLTKLVLGSFEDYYDFFRFKNRRGTAYHYFYFETIKNSFRLFLAFPSSVVFGEIGLFGPNPSAVIRLTSTPFSSKKALTI